jgi:alpha-L-arabinofuranosidase
MTFTSTFRAWAAPALLTAALAAGVQADPGKLTVQVNKPGITISPMFYGLMTEEINHAFDGGLYGELIQNRAFKDDAQNPAHWSLVTGGDAAGTIALDMAKPVVGTALTNSLRLDVTAVKAGQRVGVANEGYWGIPVKPSTAYRVSFYACAGPNFTGPLTVGIESNDGATVAATAQVTGIGTDWKQYTATLTTGSDTAPSTANRFVISAQNPGTVWLSQVSLMPPTFNDRPNGSRIDLMQKMGDMQPAFLRMPGGNYLEGNSIAEHFDWKKTVGPIDQRPGHQGPWGYRSTDGFGLLEMLEWCEDLHMQPILAVFAGFALNHEHVDAGPGLTPYVQDALDEIEYLTGDASTTWGAQRVKDGHPNPFPLTYVEIGNEDFFDGTGGYDARYVQFYDAIKAKYPKLQIIATRGDVKGHIVDVVDDHYYRSAAEMARDSGHYDKFDRKGPKIFVGEWASTEGSPTPTLQAALGDAAWLTGLERNSDLVVIEAYAPLLVNVNKNARQWGTNLIGYDALNSFGSPSYYVQKMFAANTGNVVLPTEVTPQTTETVATPLPSGKIGVATWATQAEFRKALVTNDGNVLYYKDFAQGSSDWTFGTGQWAASDGVLRQTSAATNSRAIAGDAQWTDYTYHVQAKKLSGQEGFLIAFHYLDDNNLTWWNIGGWGNTRTALEQVHNGSNTQLGPDVPVTVEANRWYDIAIAVHGRHIRCYLDGVLVEEANDIPPAPPAPLYAVASRVSATGEVIVKVVNTSATAQQMQVDLQGAQGVAKTATALVLSGDPADMNSLDAPEKVAPQTLTLTDVGPTFLHEFPAHSVTVLRLKARK